MSSWHARMRRLGRTKDTSEPGCLVLSCQADDVSVADADAGAYSE